MSEKIQYQHEKYDLGYTNAIADVEKIIDNCISHDMEGDIHITYEDVHKLKEEIKKLNSQGTKPMGAILDNSTSAEGYTHRDKTLDTQSPESMRLQGHRDDGEHVSKDTRKGCGKKYILDDENHEDIMLICGKGCPLNKEIHLCHSCKDDTTQETDTTLRDGECRAVNAVSRPDAHSPESTKVSSPNETSSVSKDTLKFMCTCIDSPNCKHEPKRKDDK